MTLTNAEKRAVAKRALERELERRAAQAQWARRVTLPLAVLGLLALAIPVCWVLATPEPPMQPTHQGPPLGPVPVRTPTTTLTTPDWNQYWQHPENWVECGRPTTTPTYTPPPWATPGCTVQPQEAREGCDGPVVPTTPMTCSPWVPNSTDLPPCATTPIATTTAPPWRTTVPECPPGGPSGPGYKECGSWAPTTPTFTPAHRGMQLVDNRVDITGFIAAMNRNGFRVSDEAATVDSGEPACGLRASESEDQVARDMYISSPGVFASLDRARVALSIIERYLCPAYRTEG